MAIARKPKASTAPKETNVDALIRKGGSVASQGTTSKEPVSVLLRIPPDILERIDARLAARTIKIPRRQWLLEAILEKLGDESR